MGGGSSIVGSLVVQPLLSDIVGAGTKRFTGPTYIVVASRFRFRSFPPAYIVASHRAAIHGPALLYIVGIHVTSRISSSLVNGLVYPTILYYTIPPHLYRVGLGSLVKFSPIDSRAGRGVGDLDHRIKSPVVGPIPFSLPTILRATTGSSLPSRW